MKTLKKQILEGFVFISEVDKLEEVVKSLKSRILREKLDIKRPEKLKGNIRLSHFKQKRQKRITGGERSLKLLEEALKILKKYFQMEN